MYRFAFARASSYSSIDSSWVVCDTETMPSLDTVGLCVADGAGLVDCADAVQMLARASRLL